jgi:hypothetical protein
VAANVHCVFGIEGTAKARRFPDIGSLRLCGFGGSWLYGYHGRLDAFASVRPQRCQIQITMTSVVRR